MATFTNTVDVAGGMTTDAQFQQYTGFLKHLFLTSGGWVQTADTGQSDFATLTHPTVANHSQGYMVVRMNDSLQSTNPVFCRVDVGASPVGSAEFAVWLRIGDATDGAGNVTIGGLPAPTLAIYGTAANAAQTAVNYGSADNNRIVALMADQNSQSGYYIIFGIERTLDPSGNYTGYGVNVIGSSGQTGISFSQLCLLDFPSQPPFELGVQYALSRANPSAFGTDVGVGIPFTFAGLVQQPGTNFAIVRNSDFTTGITATFDMFLYQGTMHFLVSTKGGVMMHSGSQFFQDTTARLAIRFT